MSKKSKVVSVRVPIRVLAEVAIQVGTAFPNNPPVNLADMMRRALIAYCIYAKPSLADDGSLLREASAEDIAIVEKITATYASFPDLTSLIKGDEDTMDAIQSALAEIEAEEEITPKD